MWFVNGEMKPVNPNTGFNIKKQLFERSILFVNEILFQFFRLKYEAFLHQVNNNHQQQVTGNQIYQGNTQVKKGLLIVQELCE